MTKCVVPAWPRVTRVPEYSEEEARKKFCCGPQGCGHFTTVPGYTAARLCLGSQCMAWRWGDQMVEVAVRFGLTPERTVASLHYPGQDTQTPPRKDMKMEDFRPEGEGWEIAYGWGTPYNSMNHGQYQRELHWRGYCAYARVPVEEGKK